MKHLINILFVLAIGLIVCCCTKTLIPTSIDLGVKTVDVQAGNFPVKITTSGVWYARTECSWIEIDSDLHKGNGTFTVNYESNESTMYEPKFNREGVIKVYTYDGASVGEIRLRQRGVSPSIKFQDVCIVPQEGGLVVVPLVTNLTDIERSRISFVCDASWISDIVYGEDGRSIIFNVTPESRGRASITMIHTDAWGIVTSAECIIRTEVEL